MINVDYTNKTSAGIRQVFRYANVVKNFGTGVYTFVPKSPTDDDCIVTASATTPLVIYGGFVQSPFDDNVQLSIADGFSVQTDPFQNVPSYLGFTVGEKVGNISNSTQFRPSTLRQTMYQSGFHSIVERITT